MGLIDADMYVRKAQYEAQAMTEQDGYNFVSYTEWLIGKTPTVDVPTWTLCSESMPKEHE